MDYDCLTFSALTLAGLLNLLADGLGDELRDEVLEVTGAGLSGHDLSHLLADQPDLRSHGERMSCGYYISGLPLHKQHCLKPTRSSGQ